MSETNKLTLLSLFKTIFPTLKVSTLKDFISCENIWFILMSVDRFHFEQAQTHAQYSLAGTLEIISKYITSVFGVFINSETTVKLAQHDDWSWGILLLYLLVMSQKREQTIGVILGYQPDVQSFFMQLISQTQQNFAQIQQSNPQINQDVMQKIQEMEIQIEQLKRALKDKDDIILNLRQDMASMKMTQQSLIETQQNLKHQQYQLLDTIGVNTFDDLIFKHSAMTRENDNLKDLLQAREQQFKNLKIMYREASMNLQSLLSTVQQQQNFTPQMKLQMQKRRSTILSKQSLSYIQNIEQHCRPLLQDIATLEKRNKLLQKQIKLLYKNFRHMLKQLKPCRQWGLLEDVPRVVF